MWQHLYQSYGVSGVALLAYLGGSLAMIIITTTCSRVKTALKRS